MTETKDSGQTKQGTVSDETGLNGLTCCDLFCDSVICGDNVATMKEWPDEFIDLVVTSPPYDNLRTYGGHEWNFEGIAEQLTRCLKPGGVIVWVVADATVNGSETLTSMRQAIHFKDVCGLNVHDTMIYQRDSIPKYHNRYEQEWEYSFVLSKGKVTKWNPLKKEAVSEGIVRNQEVANDARDRKRKHGLGNRKPTPKWVNRGNVWRYNAGANSAKDKSAFDHPAIFPEGLASDHIQSWSNPGDIVLDPFAGSGTTLKAAKELNRRYIGIEINPEYVEICNNRTAQEVLPLFTA